MQPTQMPMQNQNVMNSIQQIKQLAQLLKSSGNPQMMIYNLLNQNPNVSQMMNNFGGDPKTTFYNLARQRGIDPDQFINTIKNNF